MRIIHEDLVCHVCGLNDIVETRDNFRCEERGGCGMVYRYVYSVDEYINPCTRIKMCILLNRFLEWVNNKYSDWDWVRHTKKSNREWHRNRKRKRNVDISDMKKRDRTKE